ncbi:fibronectin type III domain-containing protein [Candidatus Nomurabacteria bacterium]|nr:fibronectin type III domain-containing protein [Candidatus Nomurabacteria bacterium]MCB9804009.1 fibronectin type III domain-containing protein [Candidatus Nomurabacteria bacterium]
MMLSFKTFRRIATTVDTYIYVIGVILFAMTGVVFAETLESTDYRIDGAVIDAGGQVPTGTTDLGLFATIGDFSGNPRDTTSSYQLRPGTTNEFLANTPIVACFETTSTGSSNCTTGPAYLNSNGMVRVCGTDGCYNKARFEIDTQNNPSDTLYGVQISTDDFVSDIQQIDGTSYKPKDLADRQLADYLTESDWETPVFNIKGLQSNTTYYVRITALHGDFTESTPSPSASATTANALITFDIDITDMAESTPETSAPYGISFTGDYKLISGGALQTNLDLIWMDLETNAEGGAAVAHKGLYGGLYSANQTYTITSATEDLSADPEGFGLQNYDYSGTETYEETYSGQSSLGTITIATNYNGAGNNVGIVDTDLLLLFGSDGPTDAGRVSMWVKAKAGNSAPADTDYTEEITIVAVGRY